MFCQVLSYFGVGDKKAGEGGRRLGGPCRLCGDAVRVADSSAVASAWKCKTECLRNLHWALTYFKVKKRLVLVAASTLKICFF